MIKLERKSVAIRTPLGESCSSLDIIDFAPNRLCCLTDRRSPATTRIFNRGRRVQRDVIRLRRTRAVSLADGRGRSRLSPDLEYIHARGAPHIVHNDLTSPNRARQIRSLPGPPAVESHEQRRLAWLR